ncbi:MAG: HD domain-containing protein [Thermodesulfobacteriota bacterium]
MVCSDSRNREWLQLWAKTKWDKATQRYLDSLYHPLLYHMLDVAAVAGLVWDHCLDPALSGAGCCWH